MVTKYGMSEELGPVEYGENQEEVFLGRSVTQTQSVSEAVAQKIDKEIRKLVDEGYVIKPHPITAHVYIADLKRRFGAENVLNKKEGGYELLLNCKEVATAPNSEMG